MKIVHLTAPVPEAWRPRLEFFIQESKTDDWKADIHHRVTGDYAEFCEDHWFVAADGEEPAAILWYGLSRRSGKGNFGHVFTAHRYRGRGLLGQLMAAFDTSFHSGPGRVLCCSAGNPIAVKTYLKHGFKMIFGGERGPMCIIRRDLVEDYSALEARLQGDSIAAIRPGTPAEQFDIDKFLVYTHAMRERGRRPDRCFLDTALTDYRQAIQMPGIVSVAENQNSETIGYAYALELDRVPGTATVNLTVHPDYWDGAAPLVADAARRYPGTARACVPQTDTAKLALFRQAGFAPETALKGYFPDGNLLFLKFLDTEKSVSTSRR